MELSFNILLFIHLVALVVGAATNVVMPIVGAQAARAAPDARAGFGAIGQRLSMNSRAALGVLVVTGIAMIYVRYGGIDGMSVWFWIKMALVVLVLLLTGVSSVLPPGRINPRAFGLAARVLLLGIVFAAVFAFN